ncbi:hypothetical protein HDU93_002745 [Gonapodya sp. JEL0774]|nr:hypothetical protein HDU93_002745 [Gonapodya sp. JEL0774]
MQKLMKKQDDKRDLEFRIQIRMARSSLQQLKKKLDAQADKERQIVRLLKASDVESAKRIALFLARDREATKLLTRLQANLDTLYSRIGQIVAERNFTKLDSEAQEALRVIFINAKEQAVLKEPLSQGRFIKLIEDRYPDLKRIHRIQEERTRILTEYKTKDPTSEDVYDLFDLLWGSSGEKTWDRPTREDIAVEDLNPEHFVQPTVVEFKVPKPEPEYTEKISSSDAAVTVETPQPAEPSKVWFIRSQVGKGDGPTYGREEPPPTSILRAREGDMFSERNLGIPSSDSHPYGAVSDLPATTTEPPMSNVPPAGTLAPNFSYPTSSFDSHVEVTLRALPPKLQRECLKLFDVILLGDFMRVQMTLADVSPKGEPMGEKLTRLAPEEMAMLAALAETKGYLHIANEIKQYLPEGTPPYSFEPSDERWTSLQPPGIDQNLRATSSIQDFNSNPQWPAPSEANQLFPYPARTPSPINLASLEAEIADALNRRELLSVAATLEAPETAHALASHPEFLQWVEEQVEAMGDVEDAGLLNIVTLLIGIG